MGKTYRGNSKFEKYRKPKADYNKKHKHQPLSSSEKPEEVDTPDKWSTDNNTTE